MIRHVSFGVRDPHRVALVLAELTHAAAVRAPTPPFPTGSRLVVFGDAQGSFLEVLPATSVFDPDAPLGIRQRPATLEMMSTHVLLSAAKSGDAIKSAALREGWRSQEVETGLFKLVKVWIDGNVLVEFLANDEADRYVEAFGPNAMASLDGRLRNLEAKLAAALSQKLPPDVLAEALSSAPHAR